ncbi:MAG: hypothetical protein R3F18_18705 [Lysobacterales bacterium]
MLLMLLAICIWGAFMAGVNYLAGVTQSMPPFGNEHLVVYAAAGVSWAMVAVLMRRWAEGKAS